jgi:hypothetical protein
VGERPALAVCAENTGHVTLEVRNGQWIATHIDPVIWFSEPGAPHLDDERLWTRWDDYIKLDVGNGTWIWKFTGRTCINRFAGNTLHEAKWPD